MVLSSCTATCMVNPEIILYSVYTAMSAAFLLILGVGGGGGEGKGDSIKRTRKGDLYIVVLSLSYRQI